MLVDEQAGVEVDGVARVGLHRAGPLVLRSARDHRASEFPDPYIRVGDDLLAVGADGAFAVDVPALVAGS